VWILTTAAVASHSFGSYRIGTVTSPDSLNSATSRMSGASNAQVTGTEADAGAASNLLTKISATPRAAVMAAHNSKRRLTGGASAASEEPKATSESAARAC
jgi:cellulase/cellobiase CelA1